MLSNIFWDEEAYKILIIVDDLYYNDISNYYKSFEYVKVIKSTDEIIPTGVIFVVSNTLEIPKTISITSLHKSNNAIIVDDLNSNNIINALTPLIKALSGNIFINLCISDLYNILFYKSLKYKELKASLFNIEDINSDSMVIISESQNELSVNKNNTKNILYSKYGTDNDLIHLYY